MTEVLGKGRGMLSLETWMPCRRPGKPRDPNIKPIHISALLDTSKSKPVKSNSSQKEPPVPPASNGDPVQLVAKYNYQSNPNRPGGFDEMSLTAGEKLTFVSPHTVNPYWWLATRENGETAYVPATYVMVLENKVTSLPWLEGKKAAKQQEQQEREAMGIKQEAVFKPYQSAYNKKADSNQDEPVVNANYHCSVCNKTLNGIYPYQAHIASKAHKEEVALVELYNS